MTEEEMKALLANMSDEAKKMVDQLESLLSDEEIMEAKGLAPVLSDFLAYFVGVRNATVILANADAR